MKRTLPPELLDRPAELSARWLLLAELHAAAAAGKKLEEGSDPEALHDFRVALRRMRGLIRAFQDHLGRAASRKIRRGLRELAQATNAARDAEVGLKWLEALGPPRPVEVAGFESLAEHLARKVKDGKDSTEGKLLPSFWQLVPKLERRLSRVRLELQLTVATPEKPGTSFGSALAKRWAEQKLTLEAALNRVRTVQDEREAHQARIEAKRLRYLIEPVQDTLFHAKEAIQLLKELQDQLGTLQDLNVLAQTVIELLCESESSLAREAARQVLAGTPPKKLPPVPPQKRPRTGLLTLLGHIGAQRRETFFELSQAWLAPEAPRRRALAQQVNQALQDLARSPLLPVQEPTPSAVSGLAVAVLPAPALPAPSSHPAADPTRCSYPPTETEESSPAPE